MFLHAQKKITFQSSAATSRSHGVITALADAQSAAALKREATTRGDTDWMGGHLPLTWVAGNSHTGQAISLNRGRSRYGYAQPTK